MFSSKGAGDLNISVECMSVTETYGIEDCIYYTGDWSTLISSWTKDTTTLSGHTLYTFDTVPITEDIDFEWKFKNSVPARWVIGFQHENNVFKGIFSKESSYYIYWTAPNSTSNSYESVSPNITTNSIVKLQTENINTINWYSNGSLLKTKSTNTSYPLRPLIRVNNSYGMTLDYVKIKPL